MPINRAFQRLKKPRKDGFLIVKICGGGICRHKYGYRVERNLVEHKGISPAS